LPYIHRFKKIYYNEIRRNLEIELTYFLDRNFLHMTLTVPRERSIPHYMKQLKKAWKALHDYLVKKYGYFDYIGVIEPQNDGYPHLHVLIFADWKLFEMDKEKAEKLGILTKEELNKYLASKGVGYVTWVKRYWKGQWDVNLALHYVTKYVRKYWKYEKFRNNKNISLFYAFLRVTKVRTIVASRFFRLRTPKRLKPKGTILGKFCRRCPLFRVWSFYIAVDFSLLTTAIPPNAKIVNEKMLEFMDNMYRSQAS